MAMKAPVNRFIEFSNVDGPSNRMAIFFQSCNFNCQFCHNPETINFCINCGACIEKCPVGALKFDENRKVVWDRQACVKCDTCLKVCPNSASPKIRWMEVDEVVEKIKEVRPYIKGITTSGGECTLQKDFLVPLFAKAHEMGLTCFVDSNGTCDFEKETALTEAMDMCMLDVKAFEPKWHQILCGHDNDLVIKNLHYLLKINKLYEVRTIIFPGKDKENRETVSEVAKIIGDKCDYKIICYRPFGVRDKMVPYLSEDETSKEEASQYVELAKSLGATRAYLV